MIIKGICFLRKCPSKWFGIISWLFTVSETIMNWVARALLIGEKEPSSCRMNRENFENLFMYNTSLRLSIY
jgi:hypothetical protein